jgi:hypothetical protein
MLSKQKIYHNYQIILPKRNPFSLSRKEIHIRYKVHYLITFKKLSSFREPAKPINILPPLGTAGIATGYGLEFDPTVGPTQPPIQWVPGVKRQGREAENSTLTSAEVKKMRIYTSPPPFAFMA